MRPIAGLALLLVLVLVALSAYIRLVNSGIGCSDWPDCYGRIGPVVEVSETADPNAESSQPGANQRLTGRYPRAERWTTPLHRLVAAVLGVLVVIFMFLALRQKRHRGLAVTLLALTAFLAILGVRSGSLHSPAVVMGNLAGGFMMVGLLGWLWFRLSDSAKRGRGAPMAAWFPGLVIVMLAAQIMLGGLTSANFAATACRTLPDCHGSWWPGPEITIAMDLRRVHAVTPSGRAIGGRERMAIHQAHRIGALLTGALIVLAGLLAVRSPGASRRTGIALLLLVVLEFSVGIAAVLTGLPIWLAAPHNWLAALLLLALIRLLALGRGHRP